MSLTKRTVRISQSPVSAEAHTCTLKRAPQGIRLQVVTLLLVGVCFAQTGRRLKQAQALLGKGSFEQAREIYRSLVPELRASQDQGNLARALNALSSIGSSLGDYGGAIQSGGEAAEIYRKLGDKTGEARAQNNVALAHLYLGNYGEALEYHRRSLDLHRQQGNTESEIVLLNNVGNVFYFQGRYLDALNSYQSALDRLNQTASEKWNARRRQMTMVNLATLFQRLGQDDRALDLYLQLRKASLALTPSEEGRLLGNLGALYRRLGDPFKALEMYRAAEKLYAREKLFDGESGVLTNIGIAQALELKDLRAAIRTFDAALELAGRSSKQRDLMVGHLYRGEARYRIGQFVFAFQGRKGILAAARKDIQQQGIAGLFRLAGARLEFAPAMIARNRIQPRGELGGSSERMEVAKRLEEHFLGQIGG